MKAATSTTIPTLSKTAKRLILTSDPTGRLYLLAAH